MAGAAVMRGADRQDGQSRQCRNHRASSTRAS